MRLPLLSRVYIRCIVTIVIDREIGDSMDDGGEKKEILELT